MLLEFTASLTRGQQALAAPHFGVPAYPVSVLSNEFIRRTVLILFYLLGLVFYCLGFVCQHEASMSRQACAACCDNPSCPTPMFLSLIAVKSHSPGEVAVACRRPYSKGH